MDHIARFSPGSQNKLLKKKMRVQCNNETQHKCLHNLFRETPLSGHESLFDVGSDRPWKITLKIWKKNLLQLSKTGKKMC